VKKYPSCLTDSQWNHIKDFFPTPKTTGRPREKESTSIRQPEQPILKVLKQLICQVRVDLTQARK
jgi:hypothetical protein